jgi:lipopolysaccharide biosynthesis glycosyltransferase
MSEKVLVVMNYDEKIKDYADNAYEINRIYCSKRGIDIDRQHMNIIPELHMAWQKLPLLASYLKDNLESSKYDYLVWIDSDAIFNQQSDYELRDFLPTCDRFLTFSEDVNGQEEGSFILSLNSGIMIVKVCVKALEFFQEVLEFIKIPNVFSFWDQSAIVQYLQQTPSMIKYCQWYPYNIIQTFPAFAKKNLKKYNPKALVYHYAGVPLQDRVNHIGSHLVLLQ